MNIRDIRHKHLLLQLSRFDRDEDFLKEVNRRLAMRPDYKSGFSSSYLSQLKTRERNIGDKTARRLEFGLKLPENAFDRQADDSSIDADIMAAVETSDPATLVEVMASIADRVSPKTAVSLARILLEKAESEL